MRCHGLRRAGGVSGFGRWALAGVFATSAVTLGCAVKEQPRPDAMDRGLVDIDKAGLQVLTADVGLAPRQEKATYVLVDVANRHEKDAMVTVGGTLLSVDGQSVGKLRMQSLRIPARGRRLFAIVDQENQVRPAAKTAAVVVLGATVETREQEVIVTDGRVDRDQGRAVVRGTVKNRANRHARAVVVAAFYDADGRPMERPSTVFDLTGGGSRGVQFAGPKGSESASLFIGEIGF